MSELMFSDLGKVSEKFRDVFENGVPRGKKTTNSKSDISLCL